MSTATTHIKTEKRSAERSRSKLVPVLRFKEFDVEWCSKQLKEITSYVDYRGRGPEKSEQGIFLVTAKNIKKGFIDYECSKEYIPTENRSIVMSKGLPEVGDILFTTEAPLGNVAQVDNSDIALAQRVIKFRGKEELLNNYLLHFMISPVYRKLITRKAIGTTVLGISGKELHRTKIQFPTLPEQQKIASFLSAVDEKIQQLTKKKKLLEQYKKGVMQQLFSGQLRFKDENGNSYPNWEDAVMQDVFERVKEKNKENNLNVMSISAQQGLVNQLEYFNRYVSAADVTGYYLLKKGDFAYNKSYSKGYPMGAIKRLDFYDKGVVSTLYICFRIKENDDSTFYKEFLDHGGINKELHKIAQEGARNHGLLNMSVIEFFRDIKIRRPSVDEQIVIGKFLEDLSVKIESAKKELTQTQTFKKGLLQQMFV